MNITVPFKKEVIQFVEDISLTAQRTSSINTIFYKSGKVYGGNTDVAGLTKSLKENKHIFQNKKALNNHLMKGLNPIGVPSKLKSTIFPFEYNDLKNLKKLLEKIK